MAGQSAALSYRSHQIILQVPSNYSRSHFMDKKMYDMQLETGPILHFDQRLNVVIPKTANTSWTLLSHSSDYNDDSYQLSMSWSDHHQGPLFRGCPHITSANFRGFQTPPSPLVSNRQQLPNPPPPPRQQSSAFA